MYDNSEFIPSTSTTAINSGFDGSAKRVSDTDRQYMTEWITNLSAKFGQHNVKLMGGYSYTYSHQSGGVTATFLMMVSDRTISGRAIMPKTKVCWVWTVIAKIANL